MKMNSLARAALFAATLAWPLSGTAAEVRQPIIAGDVEFFYGVIPASVLLGHPADHAERTMHGGVQVTRNTYHLVISLFDVKEHRRITDAQVQASISEPGLAPQTKPLQSMTMAGVVTYGNYFTMSGPGPFRITIDIRQPHGGPPAHASVEHRHR